MSPAGWAALLLLAAYANAQDLSRSATAAAQGINNTPPLGAWLPLLAMRLRFLWSAPAGTRITSGWRGPELDAVVSWSETAGEGAHTRAALDVNHPDIPLRELGQIFAASGLWRTVLVEYDRNHVHLVP